MPEIASKEPGSPPGGVGAGGGGLGSKVVAAVMSVWVPFASLFPASTILVLSAIFCSKSGPKSSVLTGLVGFSKLWNFWSIKGLRKCFLLERTTPCPQHNILNEDAKSERMLWMSNFMSPMVMCVLTTDSDTFS